MALYVSKLDGLIEGLIGEYTNTWLTSLGECAFYESNVTVLDFSKVTSIGRYAFYWCKVLTKLIIRTPTLCSVTGRDILLGADKCQIYVPDNLISQYKSATNWSQYATRIHGLSELP